MAFITAGEEARYRRAALSLRTSPRTMWEADRRVTKPFSFEAPPALTVPAMAFRPLSDSVGALIVIPNDRLIIAFEENLNYQEPSIAMAR